MCGVTCLLSLLGLDKRMCRWSACHSAWRCHCGATRLALPAAALWFLHTLPHPPRPPPTPTPPPNTHSCQQVCMAARVQGPTSPARGAAIPFQVRTATFKRCTGMWAFSSTTESIRWGQYNIIMCCVQYEVGSTVMCCMTRE